MDFEDQKSSNHTEIVVSFWPLQMDQNHISLLGIWALLLQVFLEPCSIQQCYHQRNGRPEIRRNESEHRQSEII